MSSSLMNAYARCGYRHSTVHCTKIKIGTPSAQGHYERGRGSLHTLMVRPDYAERVPFDAMVVDGQLTLDIAPALGRAYPAVWVEQGRGVSLAVRHGFMARRPDGTWMRSLTFRGASGKYAPPNRLEAR